MTEFFWSTYVVLWLLVTVLTVMVVLLYRQFGLMWMRSSRRIGLAGLDVRSTAPELAVEDVAHRDVRLTWESNGKTRGWLVLFALPGCPICKGLYETVGALSREQNDVEFVWVDSSNPGVDGNSTQRRPMGWQITISAGELAHQAMEVPAVPYAYVVKPGGVVAAKGLINSNEDIERLIASAFEQEYDIAAEGELISAQLRNREETP